MQFIVFREWSIANAENVRVRGAEWAKELQQHPAKYLKPMRLQDGTIIAFTMIGQYKGFSLVEAETEEQLQNTVSFWAPLMTFTSVPIQQSPRIKHV